MKRKRSEEKRRKRELAAQLGTEPRVDVAPKPVWENYRPPRGEEINQNVFYGPDPDSPEGIEAARVLNKKVSAELDESVRQAGPPIYGSRFAASAPPLEFDTARQHLIRNARDEPPRMYAIRRTHLNGLTELRIQDGTWTRDIYQAQVGQAHQMALPMAKDEEHRKDGTSTWAYDLVPIDYLIWAAQQECVDNEYEAALLG